MLLLLTLQLLLLTAITGCAAIAAANRAAAALPGPTAASASRASSLSPWHAGLPREVQRWHRQVTAPLACEVVLTARAHPLPAAAAYHCSQHQADR
jgi:hypothetical protein